LDGAHHEPEPEDDMGSNTLTAAEIARIEALLARLDPDPGSPCPVPGCLHAHAGGGGRHGATAAIAA
jgi:hypothetical protein